jgi:hypothetical protein
MFFTSHRNVNYERDRKMENEHNADYELPGMWEQADLSGGETDCDLPARTAEYVRVIGAAICNRAFRESLWDMPLVEIDIEMMAEEIAEQLALIDGYADVDICAHLGHDPDLDDPNLCGRCCTHIDG